MGSLMEPQYGTCSPSTPPEIVVQPCSHARDSRTISPSRERCDRFVANLTGEDVLQRLPQDIDALLDLQSGQDQRRCDLEHVPPVARVVDDQTELPGAVDDFGGGRLVGFARGAVLDQLDPLDHSQAANIADDLDITEGVDQAFM